MNEALDRREDVSNFGRVPPTHISPKPRRGPRGERQPALGEESLTMGDEEKAGPGISCGASG